jgi:hypothetical protein
MVTNAYGQDFWIGKIFQSKDKRDGWRHVIIQDIRNGRAKCYRLLYGEPGKMSSRSTTISLKGLAQRWEPCHEGSCSHCGGKQAQVAAQRRVDWPERCGQCCGAITEADKSMGECTQCGKAVR